MSKNNIDAGRPYDLCFHALDIFETVLETEGYGQLVGGTDSEAYQNISHQLKDIRVKMEVMQAEREKKDEEFREFIQKQKTIRETLAGQQMVFRSSSKGNVPVVMPEVNPKEM